MGKTWRYCLRPLARGGTTRKTRSPSFSASGTMRSRARIPRRRRRREIVSRGRFTGPSPARQKSAIEGRNGRSTDGNGPGGKCKIINKNGRRTKGQRPRRCTGGGDPGRFRGRETFGPDSKNATAPDACCLSKFHRYRKMPIRKWLSLRRAGCSSAITTVADAAEKRES